MPRSVCGLVIWAEEAKFNRPSSADSARAPSAHTTATCAAFTLCHCALKCPNTAVCPQGRSNLGRPIRVEAPAARMTTPHWRVLTPSPGSSDSALLNTNTPLAQVRLAALDARHQLGIQFAYTTSIGSWMICVSHDTAPK